MSRSPALSPEANNDARSLVERWMAKNNRNQSDAARHFNVSQAFMSAFLGRKRGVGQSVYRTIQTLADKPAQPRKISEKTSHTSRVPRERIVRKQKHVDSRGGGSPSLRAELPRPQGQDVLRVHGEKRGRQCELLPEIEALDKDCRLSKTALIELELKNRARRGANLRELVIKIKQCPCCQRRFETAENSLCLKCRKESDTTINGRAL